MYKGQSLDKLTGIIAPHQCIACGMSGSVLCDKCLLSAGDPPPSRCAGCRKLTVNYKTCNSCRSWLNLESVYVATVYEGVYESLIHAFKFDLRRQAATSVAKIMSSMSLSKYDNYIAIQIPTAPSRMRSRGFDHARLMLNEYSRLNNIDQKGNVLKRRTNIRQLGATRPERLTQLNEEFYINDTKTINNKNVLIIDDVVTTGATLSAAAKVLRKAGAKSVTALVFAQKM